MSRLIGCETEIRNNSAAVAQRLIDKGHVWGRQPRPAPIYHTYLQEGGEWRCICGYWNRVGRYCYSCDRSQTMAQGFVPPSTESQPRHESVFSGRHGYHCSCVYCTPSPERENFWAFQSDCTVDGEFVSKPAIYNAPETLQNLVDMGEALVLSNVRQTGNVGNHVHVDIRDLNDEEMLRMFQLYMRFQNDEFRTLAAGPQGGVRSYNAPNTYDRLLRYSYDYSQRTVIDPRRQDPRQGAGGVVVFQPVYSDFVNSFGSIDWQAYELASLAHGRRRRVPHPDQLPSPEPAFDKVKISEAFNADQQHEYARRLRGKGPWFSVRDNTVEFRLWNGTTSAIRLMLYTSVSAAFVQATKDGIDPTVDELTFMEVVGPYMSDVSIGHLDYHLTKRKPSRAQISSLSLASPTSYTHWEPLTETKVSEATAGVLNKAGYTTYELHELGALTLA